MHMLSLAAGFPSSHMLVGLQVWVYCPGTWRALALFWTSDLPMGWKGRDPALTPPAPPSAQTLPSPSPTLCWHSGTQTPAPPLPPATILPYPQAPTSSFLFTLPPPSLLLAFMLPYPAPLPRFCVRCCVDSTYPLPGVSTSNHQYEHWKQVPHGVPLLYFLVVGPYSSSAFALSTHFDVVLLSALFIF